MKKIILIIALSILFSSCSTMKNTEVSKNNIDNNIQETINDSTETINLSPDEEKIIDDLLK